MKITMRMMDAAKTYLDQNGPQYKIEKPASVWLSMETKNANPNATWQALNEACQTTIDKVATLL